MGDESTLKFDQKKNIYGKHVWSICIARWIPVVITLFKFAQRLVANGVTKTAWKLSQSNLGAII
jgi:hypothetical protein